MMTIATRLRGRGQGFLAGIALCALMAGSAGADTIEGALAKAYVNNPTLNAQRASLRATDELVPQALSGYRPTVDAQLSVGREVLGSRTDLAINSGALTTRSASITANQNLFDGLRTRNNTRASESQVLAARETLRNAVQNTLFDAAQAYMDVLRDAAILDLRKNNLEVLEEELRATRERFNVGVVTRTDVAQAESAVAGAKSDVSGAEAQLNTSRGTYRQVIGVEAGKPVPARAIDRHLPRSLGSAIDSSQTEHPAVRAALHGVDAAQIQIRVIEGELYPTLSLQGNVSTSVEPQLSVHRSRSASIFGILSVPIYEGGQVYSRARQAKETAGQRRLEADEARDQVRAAVVSAWGSLEAARAQIISAQAQVAAAEVAFAGTREEVRVGERTTLDLLIQQQALLDARTSLVQAQRDRIVASYALLSAAGGLSTGRLGLKVNTYDPTRHYNQVRDKWIGLRTPSGM
jgi:outer membrane protein